MPIIPKWFRWSREWVTEGMPLQPEAQAFDACGESLVQKQDRTLFQPPHHCDLSAIAKARSWIDDIRLGHLASFQEIAEREGQGERHIREWRLNPQQQALSEIGAMFRNRPWAVLGRVQTRAQSKRAVDPTRQYEEA